MLRATYSKSKGGAKSYIFQVKRGGSGGAKSYIFQVKRGGSGGAKSYIFQVKRGGSGNAKSYIFCSYIVASQAVKLAILDLEKLRALRDHSQNGACLLLLW